MQGLITQVTEFLNYAAGCGLSIGTAASIGSGRVERIYEAPSASPYEVQISSRVRSVGWLAILCVLIVHFVF